MLSITSGGGGPISLLEGYEGICLLIVVDLAVKNASNAATKHVRTGYWIIHMKL